MIRFEYINVKVICERCYSAVAKYKCSCEAVVCSECYFGGNHDECQEKDGE